MKRLILIYNPRSSRYLDVKKDVLSKVADLKSCMVGKYEVKKTSIDENVKDLAKVLDDGDLVVAAGGDATGVIAVNGIMKSGKDATLAVLPYGNFNDLARTLGTKTLEDILDTGNQNTHFGTHSRPFGRAYSPEVSISDCRDAKLYPLEIIVDGEFWRYASCYVTMGMTAEAVKLYDSPAMRKQLKTKFGRAVGSYTGLAGWYLKNRRKKRFLPEFALNGVPQDRRTSDYAAVNGRSMARVMKGGDDWMEPKRFRSETDRLTSFWRLLKLMSRSILVRVPGKETTGDVLEFVQPGRVEIQAEGESRVFEGVSKIEIRKAGKWLKVIKI